MHQFEALPGRELGIASGIFRGTIDSVAFPNTVACQSGSPVTRYDNGNKWTSGPLACRFPRPIVVVMGETPMTS